MFLCFTPFLWGKVRDPSASSLLSACYAGLLTVFQFWNVVWLWMLLTGLGDELSGCLSALFQAAAYNLPTVGPSAFPVFAYWMFTWRSVPCSFSLLWCAQSILSPLLCVPFQFLVYYSFFYCGVEFSLSRGLCWFIPRVAVGIPCATYFLTSCFFVSKAGLELVSEVQEPSCFLIVMCCKEALYRLGVQGVRI
jgi:hypothetical protein